jgi:hypothetical protein
MTERLSALFCIGCDRLDVPEPCLGACDERVLDLVSAKDHDEARAQVGKAIQQADKLRELLIQLVSKMPEPSAPMPDDWADTHHALQAQARTVLHEIDPSGALEEADRITAWRCLTCGLDRSRAGMSWDLCAEPGRLRGRTRLDDVSSQYDQSHQEMAELAAVVRQFAWVTPRPGEGERTWQSLRAPAQRRSDLLISAGQQGITPYSVFRPWQCG